MQQQSHLASARIAYRILRGLARVDGPESAAERQLLYRLGEALGLSESERATLPPLHSLGELPESERPADLQREGEHVLALLLRVAAADGFTKIERDWLEAERQAWNVSPASFARLALDAHDAREAERTSRQQASEQRRIERAYRRQRQTLITAGLFVVAAVLIGWRARSHFETRAGWHEVEHEIERSLVLVATRYVLERGEERELELLSLGTGFVVADGCVATNKHVVEPWKFASCAQHLAEGWRLAEDSVVWALWPEGARVLDAQGQLDFSRAVSSVDGSVRLLARAPDAFELREVRVRVDGKTLKTQREVHADDNNDLALLSVSSKIALAPAPLGALSAPRKTDDVLIVGFPRGTSVFEDGIAECSPVAGSIRKMQSTILVSAPVLDGNSGGPLLDRDGRVIGIATRVAHDASMGVCIAVEHLQRLLAEAGR